MHKIAVCENNPLDAAALQNILDDYEHNSREDLNVKIFPDAESILNYFAAEHYSPEILITDISLPGISGIEAVRILRESGFSGEVIFTTSSPDHALTAYELSARQYFLKPINPQKVFTVLQEIMHSRRDAIMIRNRKALRRILFSDILYCETHGKYQVIHTRSEEIRFRVSAHEMKTLVPPPVSIFTALGSAYLINIMNIDTLIDGRVIFDCGKELLLSRKNFQKLRKDVKNFYHLSAKT